MRPRYAAWFAAVLGVLGVLAVYLIAGARSARPVTTSSSADTEAGAAGHLVPHIGDPTRIQPSAEEYRRFAEADAEWRRRFAPPVTARRFASADGDAWRPEPRDVVRDSVYALSQRGRLSDAIVVLEQWVASHPRDAGLLLELARLLNQVGRTDDSLVRYRQVLALGEGREDAP